MKDYGYGLWALVIINSAVFILFAISFFHPSGGRDWRALGGFSAFIVALFAEMYGYPLTVGFLAQWPTLPTLVMFGILVVIYRRLAIREECDVRGHFGAEWDAYATRTPRFMPAFHRAAGVIPTDHRSGSRTEGAAPHRP